MRTEEDARGDELAQVLGKELRGMPSRHPDDDARERLIAALPTLQRERSWMPRIAIGAGVLVAAAAAAWLWIDAVPGPTTDLRVQVDGADAPVEGFVAAPVDRDVVMGFSEGSTMTLEANARVRLANVDGDGATVILESGAVDARIRPRPDARWVLDAGPFRVRVTGTSFRVAWSPESERFELRLREGSVQVTGPGLNEPLAMRGEQTLRIEQDDTARRVELTHAREARAPAATPPPGADLVEVPRRPPLPNKRPASRAAPAAPTWSALAAERRYADAVAAARGEGLERLCRVESGPNLRRLADVARFARDVEVAEQVLTCIRERFAGSALASEALFDRGRLACDVRRAHVACARAFEAYLREAPTGPLAEEARQRVMDAWDRSGRSEDAALAARRYLEHHPRGFSAERARRLLEANPSR
ncbi:MAG: FecR domain-containing protein [Myxococcales bacterium]|nr:FecR domain-containing protein [Myxococcales bacterium]